MPAISRPISPPNGVHRVAVGNDILDSGVPVSELSSAYVSLGLYGRNGTGKTSLACQSKKPLALIAIDPSLTGGARSVTSEPGVVVYQVSNKPLRDRKTGQMERVWGSEKIIEVAESLTARFARGERPFESVVIDGVTSWNEIILQEVLGVKPDEMPAILGFGKVSQDQYTERSERMMRYLRPFTELPCNLTIIAQEKDHNPPKDAKGRVLGSKLVRPMQEESFFSLAIGDAACLYIQNACDFICQLSEDAEYTKVMGPAVKIGSETRPGEWQLVPTGKRCRVLRTRSHPNYAGRARSPDYSVVPERIVGGSPAQMWAAFQQVVRGERTERGEY